MVPTPPPLVLVQRDNQTEKQKEKKVTYIAALSPKYHYRITEMAHFSFQVGGRGGEGTRTLKHDSDREQCRGGGVIIAHSHSHTTRKVNQPNRASFSHTYLRSLTAILPFLPFFSPSNSNTNQSVPEPTIRSQCRVCISPVITLARPRTHFDVRGGGGAGGV